MRLHLPIILITLFVALRQDLQSNNILNLPFFCKGRVMLSKTCPTDLHPTIKMHSLIPTRIRIRGRKGDEEEDIVLLEYSNRLSIFLFSLNKNVW